MAPLRISAALDLAWQIGADTAMRGGSEFIEPAHLLYGLYQLEKPINGSAGRTPAQLDEINQEACRLAEMWRGLTPDFGLLESNSAPARQKGTMSRSPRLKKMFELANSAAQRNREASVSAPTFLMVLIENATESDLAPFGASVLRERLGKSASPDADTRDIEISQTLAADDSVAVSGQQQFSNRFAQLCELSWEMGATSRIEPVLQAFCERLLRLLPHAERISVLLSAANNKDELLLKAHAPSCPHRISLTCAQKAIEDRRAFIWQRTSDLTVSQLASDLQSGIYVPMIVEREVLGVICLDSSNSATNFTSDDLYFTTAVAHQLALAIANRSLQVKLAANAEVLERLLTNFSPQVRRRLLQRAQQGKLRLGGERSEVSVLCSDIRGFTRISAAMDAEDIVSMLNDYFSALTECIFRNDGTVDKFVGDAILAVFGSPDPDPQHRKKAVQAALDMQQAMIEVNRRRSQRSEQVCEIGIGVHSGEVLHGFIGSVERMEFTVIGDAVNKTARYCDGAKGTEILISPDVHQHVWRMVDAIPTSIATKHEGDLPAYRVIGIKTGI